MIFTPDDIQTRLRERPFSGVRIVTTTGEKYDIHYPNLVLVARQFLVVGTPSAENSTQADQVTRIALFHVVELRDLPSTAPPGNGSMG
jgi:hypothetical protein